MAHDHHHHHHHHPHKKAGFASRRDFLASLISTLVLAPYAFGQERSTDPTALAQQFRRISEEAELEGLAAPYRGISASVRGVEPGLFQIAPTGVSTEPVRTSLSARGFELTRNIMRLNETLAELSEDHVFLGEWLYFITILGRPSATEPWGWQLSGHHAIINYFVLGDQVVMTPLFIGSEPVTATSGKYKGISILQQEQNDGLAMLHALPEAQRQQAVMSFSKTGNNNLTEAFKDNIDLDYAGLRTNELPGAVRQRLRDLVHLYISNMDDGHARVKMDEFDKHIDNTWFSWIGAAQPDSVFYYRIHSPVILIEFDHQRPANLRKFARDPNKPDQSHIHCVVRTPNGNDYGKDLLRQHYLAHKHQA
jgi:hypothetical protein